MGIYGLESPLPGFRRFIRHAEEKGLLPGSWSSQSVEECIALGTNGTGWSQLHCAVEKSDIQEHYNNSSKPMQLGMLAEEIYGTSVMTGPE